MKTKLVRIGNSHGVRLPKAFIEEAQLTGEIEISLEAGTVVIRSAPLHPRAGWAEAFARMRELGDDELLDEYTPTDFDENEWEWQ